MPTIHEINITAEIDPAAKSTGGNGSADADKLLIFNSEGQIQGSADSSSLAAVKGTASGSAYGVHGESASGTGVVGQSINGNGVDASSTNKQAVSAINFHATEPPLKVKNANLANTAKLAQFHRLDNKGLDVLNDGGLEWDSPTGAQTTKTNLGLGNVDNTSDANKPVSTAVAAALTTYQQTSEKGAAGGYAPLDGTGLVPPVYLPSFVDDVVEADDFASLPGTGESGKLYVTLDDGKVYRWSGSAYAEIVGSPGSTDAVPEGASNLYFTSARVLETVLSGLSLAAGGTIVSSDTVLAAFGKLQKQITDHLANTSNPHSVTKAQVGLGNADNTSDANKPVSTATQTALDAKLSAPTVNTNAASYTLALTDANDFVTMNVASSNNCQIPTKATVAFPIGTIIQVTQTGAGQTTITAAGGVTLRAYAGWVKLAGQYATATLTKIGPDEWHVAGNLVA